MFSNIIAGAAGFPVADLGDTVSQSLRFRGADFFTRNFSSAFQDNVTISFWFKIVSGGSLASNNDIRGAFYRSSNVNSLYYQWDGSTSGIIQNAASTAVSTDPAVFRDPNAWYHLVYRFNDTANTHNLWINGAQLIDNVVLDNPFSTGDFTIGTIPGQTGGQWTFKGYMADWYLIDGQALLPTAFGRENDDGVWVPVDYSGSFGSNGFHLDFADSSDLGNDVSGNNNDFTKTGFDTAAISSSNEDNDVDFLDTPTNNYAVLNPLNIFDASVTYSKANLRANYGGSGNRVVFADMPMDDGKYYWECTLKDQVEAWVGVITEDYEKRQITVFSDNSDSWAYDMSGSTDNQKNHNGSNSSSHGAAVAGDTIGFLLDIPSGTLKIEINGATQSNSEFTNIPTNERLFVAFNIGGASGNVNMDWNFGQMAFQHEPTGYQHVATNSLPEPTIKNGSDHFQAITDTGANILTAAQAAFSNGLWWIKDRANSNQHQLVDSVRGSNSALNCPNLTVATYSAPTGNSVAWCWNVDGTAAENTDGTLTAQVAANTDAGFSIISWTGTNAAGTVGHGLTEAPEFIINKNSVNATSGAFYAWHTGIPATQYVALGDSAAAATSSAVWNDTAPTNSVISLGTAGNANDGPGRIMYAWHSVEGFSKFGKYTGNGSSDDGPFVYLGFRPALLVVRSLSGRPWMVYDSTRNSTNPVNLKLYWNEAHIENQSDTTSSNIIDFLSNGFKLRESSGQANGSSEVYTFMAWAENPFGGENVPPATAR